MNSRYPLHALREVLTPDLDEVPIDPLATYHTAGILSFGRGLFARPTITGAETSYKRYFRLHQDQVVFSRLFAWEGAAALVTAEFDGYFVSSEFPTLTVNRKEAVPQYLGYLMRWPEFHHEMRGATRGLGLRRQRVHVEEFLAIEVPLPDIEEQRDIVRDLDRVSAALTDVDHGTSRSVDLDRALIDQAIDEFLARLKLGGWQEQPLRQIAEINPKPVRRPAEGPVSFVAMAGVDDRTGSIHSFELRQPEEVATGYKQFKNGDVIFARITPCMQNGKSAVVRDLPTEVAYGSTEFHVIRPSNGATADWIHRIVRTRSFREGASARFQGTAGQQRVPASFLEEATIPIPPTPQAEEDALAKIDALLDRGGRLRTLRQRSLTLGKATRFSMLNVAFGGVTRLQR